MTSASRIRDRIVQHVEESGFGAHGLHVLIGEDVAEHRWKPDVREEIHSVAKGICVLAAGIAANEGLVDLDAPVIEYIPGIPVGDGVELVTLRHLLSMSSGVDLPWSETMMTDWPDLALEFLRRPSRGRVFQYSNASTYTAMFILAQRVGDVHEYLVPRLLTPIGLGDVPWTRCPHGRIVAGEGLALRTEELSRIGRLIRDRGFWDGQQLVPAHVIDAMHSDWVPSGKNPGYQRYALGGWDGPGPAWRLHGAMGQLLIFCGDTVVTITASDHFGADAVAAYVAEFLSPTSSRASEPTSS